MHEAGGASGSRPPLPSNGPDNGHGSGRAGRGTRFSLFSGYLPA